MTDRAPPDAFRAFSAQFPGLARAWDEARAAEESGPLDEGTRRLIKLAIAVGAQKTGATRSAARKAAAAGVPREAIAQVVALSASTIGFPSAVAAHGWITDALAEE